jgi:hypothetical protein
VLLNDQIKNNDVDKKYITRGENEKPMHNCTSEGKDVWICGVTAPLIRNFGAVCR